MRRFFRVIPFLLFFLLIGFGSVSATPQFPDTLIFEGKEYPVGNDLMYDYFLKFPEKNPKEEGGRCSALWRGYRSTYEVIEGRIFLKDIFIGGCSTPDSALSKIVPSGERLAIDWFSGFLEARYGNNSEDAYSLEFLEAWEKYSIFQISNGRLDEVRHFDNKGFRKFKKEQFQAYKKTKEYEDEARRLTADGSLTKSDLDKEIEFWILSSTKKFLIK